MRSRVRSLLVGLAGAALCVGACSGVSDSTSSIPVLVPDEVLPPNSPRTWDLAVHCGAGVFSYRINGTWWRTAEAAGQTNWLPKEWGDVSRVAGIEVVLEINETGDVLLATRDNRTVVYEPTELTDADLCD